MKFGDYLFTIPLVVREEPHRRQGEARERIAAAGAGAGAGEVRDKNVQLEASLKRVEEMAATDPLTGLYNRRHFGTRARSALRRGAALRQGPVRA